MPRKRTQDGQRKLTLKGVEEGERKGSSHGVHSSKSSETSLKEKLRERRTGKADQTRGTDMSPLGLVTGSFLKIFQERVQ